MSGNLIFCLCFCFTYSGWLSGGKTTNMQEKSKPKVTVTPEEKMVCR